MIRLLWVNDYLTFGSNAFFHDLFCFQHLWKLACNTCIRKASLQYEFLSVPWGYPSRRKSVRSQDKYTWIVSSQSEQPSNEVLICYDGWIFSNIQGKYRVWEYFQSEISRGSWDAVSIWTTSHNARTQSLSMITIPIKS